MNKFLIIIFSATLLSGAAHAAGMGNAEIGKTKALPCQACHGEAGAKPIAPEYPVLAGQNYDYLVEAMKQYKLGKRKNAMMSASGASMYTLKEIDDIAAYFATQSSTLKMKY